MLSNEFYISKSLSQNQIEVFWGMLTRFVNIYAISRESTGSSQKNSKKLK